MRNALLVVVFLALPVLMIGNMRAQTNWDALGTEARMLLGFESQTRRALDTGMLPLWNPYHFGGRPHLADPGTLALYPPHVLLRFLPIDWLFIASFVFHCWIFGIGGYLLAQQLGASRIAALLASTGAVFATLLTPGADLPYSGTVYPVAWLPIIVALSMRSIRRPGPWPHPGLVAAAVMASTGPPRGALYGMTAIVSCYLFAALWPQPGASRRKPLIASLLVLAGVVAGLSAFQLVPYFRLWATAARSGGLARERVRERPTTGSSSSTDRLLASVLSGTSGSRVIAQCSDVVDASRFLPMGVPSVEGYGGAFLADYGRFASVVSDTRGDPSELGATMTPAIRTDLLAFVNAGYVVACSTPEPDRWAVVTELEKASVAHARKGLPRAFWTCSPQRVTRDELEYHLRTFRYDETLTLREANPIVHVRWTADFDESARHHAEAELKLRPRRFVDGRTWQYDLNDASRANLAAIVSHPAVEDTAGFERGGLSLPQPPAVPPFPGRRSEWIIGLAPCEDARPASVEHADRADGYFAATIDAPRDGLVFLSETYFTDRTVWLDGARVDALKVNYAFTGVPVSAGVHRIELRAAAGTFWFGSAVTALTLVLMAVWFAARRRGGPPAALADAP